MEAIIDNIAYYDLTEVQHKNPNFGKGAPNANKIIEKEKIPADAFIFVSFSKKKGKFTKLAPDSTYKSRKCMILKSWIDTHVHPFAIGKKSCDDNDKESKKYPPVESIFKTICSTILAKQDRILIEKDRELESIEKEQEIFRKEHEIFRKEQYRILIEKDRELDSIQKERGIFRKEQEIMIQLLLDKLKGKQS